MEIKDDEGNSGEMKYIPVARSPKDARRAFGRNHIALTPRSKRSARGGKPSPVKFFA